MNAHEHTRMVPHDSQTERRRTINDWMMREDAVQLPTYRKWPVVASAGRGAWITDVEGNRWLDFYGGHCVALLGHAHPAVAAAVAEQVATLTFYSNAVYSPVRTEAARLLVDLAPRKLTRVFFCNSGTEANEAALKLARKGTGRSMIAALEGDFHGRTLGSLAATWKESYRTPYSKVLADVTFLPFGDLASAEVALADSDVAALILEPIQSMHGMREAPASYFRGLRELCSKTGTWLIFDEVQTGVGRTGTFSVSEQYGMTPDVITLAKSLGSGLPVGAVLVTDAVSETVQYGDQGSTFGGGMVAMAAVKATLVTVVGEKLMIRAQHIERMIRNGLPEYSIRGSGCLLGIDMAEPVAGIVTCLRQRGVLAGASLDPNVMRLMPPAVATDHDIEHFLTVFRDVLADLEVL